MAQYIRAQAAPMFIALARLSIKPSSLTTRQRFTICVVIHHSRAIAVVTYRLGSACGCWQAVRIGAVTVVLSSASQSLTCYVRSRMWSVWVTYERSGTTRLLWIMAMFRPKREHYTSTAPQEVFRGPRCVQSLSLVGSQFSLSCGVLPATSLQCWALRRP